MKKILMLFILFGSISFGAVDECKSNVYFANGIDTSKGAAYASRDRLEENFKSFNPTLYNKVANWKVNYNHTHGIAIDLYESFLQKIYEDKPGTSLAPFIWNLDEIADYFSWSFRGVVRKITEKAPKAKIKEYAAGLAKKLARKTVQVYNKYGKKFTEEQIEAMFNDAFDYLIEKGTESYLDKTEEEIIEEERQDVTIHLANFIRSVSQGYGVIVVAHSQGNLFTNRAYNELSLGNSIHGLQWMQQYISMIGVATPANNVLGKDSPYLTFDNDMIQLVPDSLSPNVTNPKRYYLYNAAGENIGETLYSVRAHSFLASYMATDITRDAILGLIDQKIVDHGKRESQWEIDKKLGCVCQEKYVKVKHKFLQDKSFLQFSQPGLEDIKNNFLNVEKSKIRNFAEDREGKIYQVGDKYVRAVCGGTKIKKIDEGDACLVLEDEEDRRLGVVEGTNESPEAPGGLFTAQLFWNEPAVQMQLESSLMGESVSGCGMAAAGSGELTLYDVYPGTYPVNVTDVEGYEELDENLSDTITLSIGTPGASRVDRLTITDKYQYPNLGVGGHVADIVIFREDPKEPPVPLLVPLGGGGESSSYSYGGGGGGGGGASFKGGSSTKIPKVVIKPPLCTPAKSCGCLPCKYKILTYLSQARLGPIAGADVRLYRARDEGKVQRELLYEGKTTIGTSVDEAGIIRLPVPYPQQPESEYSDEQREFLSRIKGYEGDFILEVSGGYDIDANDDLVTDSNFKRFNGVLHLILSKERLMQNDYKVNILTEIGYQLCKDLLGEYYDSRLVQERLDDIASRILIEKLYPDVNASIGRDDLMWWIPSAHKNWLVKSYDRYLEPIVMKLYEGEDIYNEAYEFVYAKPESISVPLLKSRWFRVDENLSGGSPVGAVEPVSEGESPIESYTLEGEGKELFRIDSDGMLYLEENATLDYELKQYYEFSIVAKNGAGESRPVTLYVIVNNIPDVPEFVEFEGGSVPEDAFEGEVAGRVLFDPAGAPIDRIELEGKDASSFIVELNGTIRVSADAKLDYERSPAAHIAVKAHNAYGYSRGKALSIVVVDKIDVPMVKSVSTNLPENAPAGTRVAKVQIKSDDPITDVVLEGSGSENFTIDNEGVIRVAEGASLDYEKRVNYSLNARASNVQGTSRPAPIRIRLQNMPDVPELKRSEYRVMEGAPAGTYVGDIALSSVDVSQVSEYRLLSGADNFTVDREGRIYAAVKMPSYDQREFFEIYVAAKNEKGWGPKQIQVIYIDTHRPIIGSLSTWVYENASAGTEIGNIPVVRSSSAIERFEITGSGSKNFKIDAAGLVTVAPGATLDYESRSYYRLRVTAYNKSGASKSRSLYVRVVDRDDSLVIRGFSTRIHEDLAEGSTLGVVSVLRNGGIEVDRFVIDGEGKEHFHVDRSGLFKIQKGGFDDKVKNLYSFKVWAVGKDGSRSNEAEVNIAVDDALRGRPVLASFELEIEENTTVGSVLGKMPVVDEGSSPIEGYEISANMDRVFGIDEYGTIRLKSALDYERISSYNLMIRAYNRTSYSDVLHLPVKVINIPDTPPKLVTFITYVKIEENLPSGTVAGKVGIIDQGEAPIERFILTGGGSENFIVDLNGTIRVAEGATIDYESRRHYFLKATAYNSIGASNPADVRISVLNVPEYPPELYDINETVMLDTPVSATIANILKSAGDTPIESIELSKQSPFAVDKSGRIYLDKPLGSEECSYSLEARARNGFGFSDPAKIEIEIEGRIDVEDLALEVPFGLSSGESAANLKISEVCKKVESIELTGEGSGDFTIDSHGVIRVADGVVLSFFKRPRYDLQVLINGGEYRADVQIGVKQVIDSVPTLPVGVEKALPAEHSDRVLLFKRSKELNYAEIVEISDPVRPDTVAAIELPLISGDVAISSGGETLAILNVTTVDLIDIEDPMRPILKRKVELGSDESLSLYVSHSGEKLTVAYPYGIEVYSTALDDFGTQLGFKSIPECSLQYFTMSETRLYLACYRGISKKLYDIEIDGNGSRHVTFYGGSMPSRILPFEKLSKAITKYFEGTESDKKARLGIFYFSGEPFSYNPKYLQGKGYRDFVVSEDSGIFYGLDRNGTAIDIVDMQNPIEMSLLGRVDLPLEVFTLSFARNGVVYALDRDGSVVAIDARGYLPLPKPPGILGFRSMLFNSERAPAVGSKIGSVKILYSGEGGIDSFYLSGEDAAHFYIDDNGTIYLKEPLDLNSYGWSYRFRAGATNAAGSAETDVEYLDVRISDTGEFL